MSTSTASLTDELRDYVHRINAMREHPVLAELRGFTAKLPNGNMQISVEHGRMMAQLVKLLGVTRALEVGTFTGYSSTCVALALPPAPHGRLVCCDVSEEWTNIAKAHWAKAGVADKITLKLGPAEQSLAAMLKAGEAGSYDMAFIDADKPAYPGYYLQCVELLRPGGIVLLDNAFMGGKVVSPPAGNAGAQAMHDLAERIFNDPGVDPCLIPIGDGVLVARKTA